MIDRSATRIDSIAHRSVSSASPLRTAARSSGRANTSTSSQPSAANRLDIDPRCTSTTSRAIPWIRFGSSAQASTMRWKWSAGGAGSASRTATASATTASATSSAAYSAALPRAATSAIAPGSTNAAAPSSASRAVINRSNPGPGSPHGPAHVDRPMRWPSRRVRSKTSAVPPVPSSAHVTSIAAATTSRYTATSSRAKRSCGNVRRSTNSSSGSLRRSICQSAMPLLASASATA